MNNQRKQLCLNYLKARKAFLEEANKDDVLHGNDNIVGRIGEAIAHSFLEQLGKKPEVVRNQSKAGYDIICLSDNSKISVKMITSENKSGSTSQIKHEWHELIGIELGEDLKVIKLGLITRKNFELELTKRNQRLAPNFSRAMLKETGVFAKAGKIYIGEELAKYNLL
ncbi:hypothetical protein ACFPH8_05645 [Bizionia hallyeonensis]|uniref:Restriction endonuclease n=1 Tax=Bizionia hallyeonensis TaxID=1123757 RepID=A0ABW0C512_9FLAO